MSVYTRTGGRRTTSTGSALQTLDQTSKAEQGEALAREFERIFALHREDFPPARPPIALPAPRPDVAEIKDRHLKQALHGIGLFQRRRRAAAGAAAASAAEAELCAHEAQGRQAQAREQTRLDQLWERLHHNDPEVVFGTLVGAFEDNEAAAAPISVMGSEASVVVLVPPASAVPERRPIVTAAGNPSLKKLTKRESAEVYRLMVSGFALATVKEAFAVAPALAAIRIVAVRRTGPDAYGREQIEAVLAARVERAALSGVRWQQADADRVIHDASDQLAERLTGPSKEIAALDLGTEPEIAAVVQAIDLKNLRS